MMLFLKRSAKFGKIFEFTKRKVLFLGISWIKGKQTGELASWRVGELMSWRTGEFVIL
jgi:hypothetical protein